jgi:uncharacterized protein
MNLYDATVPLFTKYLTAMDRWLDKAGAYADHKKVDPALILESRLALDQYNLMRQFQSAADQAKFTVAKMTGKTPPSNPDTEKTLPEIRARLMAMVAYMGTFKREDFVDCEDRPCSHTWMGGKTVRAGDYLDHLGLPNFHFHMSMAYAILRNLGLDLGKMDYLVDLPFSS